MNKDYRVNKKGLEEIRDELISKYKRVIRVSFRSSSIPKESATLKNIRWAMVSKKGSYHYRVEGDRTVLPELAELCEDLIKWEKWSLSRLNKPIEDKDVLIDWALIERYRSLKEWVAGGDYRRLDDFTAAAQDVAVMLQEAKGVTEGYLERIRECVIPLNKDLEKGSIK